MTRQAVIPWSDNDIAEALQQWYRVEPEGVVRTRLHALRPNGMRDLSACPCRLSLKSCCR